MKRSFIALSVCFTQQVRNWLLDRINKRIRYEPAMTTCYQSHNGINTNNDIENFNLKMAEELGHRPNLPKAIKGHVRQESVTERDWLQRDRKQGYRRPEDRVRFQQRKEWELELDGEIAQGLSDEKLLEFIDRMVVINKRKKKS